MSLSCEELRKNGWTNEVPTKDGFYWVGRSEPEPTLTKVGILGVLSIEQGGWYCFTGEAPEYGWPDDEDGERRRSRFVTRSPRIWYKEVITPPFITTNEINSQ